MTQSPPPPVGHGMTFAAGFDVRGDTGKGPETKLLRREQHQFDWNSPANKLACSSNEIPRADFSSSPESAAGTFSGLETADRQALSAWLDYAGAGGIDAVMDLAVRRWNVAGASAIFGVFEVNRCRASWLIVQAASGWVLARCADGLVSNVTASLPEILMLIDNER